eukprot:COSAG06_NODE_568_length_14183_cov_130.573843_13_plen_74_part_00
MFRGDVCVCVCVCVCVVGGEGGAHILPNQGPPLPYSRLQVAFVRGHAEPCGQTVPFLRFPDVCPEPVLVKCSF